jgi:adenylylsulfate kinase
MTGPTNVTAVEHLVGPAQRLRRYGHHGGVLWLTGLSGSGKSTLGIALEATLLEQGYACFALDGDNVRTGLNADLGFSPHDRAENIRRVGEVAALFAEAGLVCITSFISPYAHDRQLARKACRAGSFHEVFISTNLETCEMRDPKGLYRKARSGQLASFTGISAPYEHPENPELTIDTAHEDIEISVARLVRYVHMHMPRSMCTAPALP